MPAQSEFDRKNNFLASVAAPVSPCDMYTDLYGDDYDNPRPYVVSTGSRRIMRSDNMDDLLDLAICHDDIYVHPCTFCRGRIGLGTLQRIYAFVVDLDHVNYRKLMRLSAADYLGLRPTYIVNSGYGLHLYFVLSQPVEAYNWIKPTLQAMHKGLKRYFAAYGADQIPSLIQSYRIAGSLSKSGRTTTVYRIGHKWTINDLADRLALPIPTRPQQSERAKNIVQYPTARRGFYGHVLSRMHEVSEGHRETAMFALAVAAYKSRVKRDRLEADMLRVYNQLCAKGKPMRPDEVTKAMTGYQAKYVRARSTRIEEWLGLDFPRRTKRNGRSKEDHGRYRRACRAAKQSATIIDAISTYLTEHPTASNRELSRALGYTMRTVAKYRASLDASASAGGSSNIAFNTSPLGGRCGVSSDSDYPNDISITTTSSVGWGRAAGHPPPVCNDDVADIMRLLHADTVDYNRDSALVGASVRDRIALCKARLRLRLRGASGSP